MADINALIAKGYDPTPVQINALQRDILEQQYQAFPTQQNILAEQHARGQETHGLAIENAKMELVQKRQEQVERVANKPWKDDQDRLGWLKTIFPVLTFDNLLQIKDVVEKRDMASGKPKDTTSKYLPVVNTRREFDQWKEGLTSKAKDKLDEKANALYGVPFHKLEEPEKAEVVKATEREVELAHPARAEAKPSYHYETNDQGQTSVFQDGKLVSGSGKGKTKEPRAPEKPEKPEYSHKQALAKVSSVNSAIARMTSTGSIDPATAIQFPALAAFANSKDPKAVAEAVSSLKLERDYVSDFLPKGHAQKQQFNSLTYYLKGAKTKEEAIQRIRKAKEQGWSTEDLKKAEKGIKWAW